MKRRVLIACAFVVVALIAVVAIYVNTSPKANYIWSAYFYPGSSSNLRGYPIVYPPSDFTGTWTDYSYRGDALATHEYVNGDAFGKQVYLKDDGSPYLVRYLNKEGWERDEVNLGPPPTAVIPWYLPQRWVNRSLERLAVLDKIFPTQPEAVISEVPPK